MNETEVPAELAGALHAAALAAPPYDGDLGLVRARGRARRHRRAAAVAGVASLAAAAVLAIPVTIGTLTGPDATDQPSLVRSGPSEPVWLLVAPYDVFTRADAAEYVATDGNSVSEEALSRYGQLYGELRQDGSVVELDPEIPGFDWIYRMAAMPGGRLAALTIDWSGGGGDCEQSTGTVWLHVIEPDGSVSLSQELDRISACDEAQTPELLSADAHNVYLAYPNRSQLVAHELATGREQVLDGSPEALTAGFRASVAGGRVVMVIPIWPAGQCGATVRVTVPETGASRDYQLPPTGCAEPTAIPIGPFQVSPDGRYAGAALNHGDELRFVALDLDTGSVVVDERIVDADGEEYRGTGYGERALNTTYGSIAGLTWIDSSTVRVAWYEPPDSMELWTDAIRSTDFVMPAGG
jgi:hypothetical protein